MRPPCQKPSYLDAAPDRLSRLLMLQRTWVASDLDARSGAARNPNDRHGASGQTGAQGSGDIEGQRANQIRCPDVCGTQDRTRRVIEPMPFGGNMSDSMRNHLRRRLAQINRRSPIEKATPPLKLILHFIDLDETARQMDMLQRALEEARPIAHDESLDEEQKRVNLRKTLKAATSAIWASHHSGGKRQHGHGNRQ